MTAHPPADLRCRRSRFRRWTGAALVVAALLAAPLRADWTVVWKVSRESLGKDDDPHPVTVLLKGDRARFERSSTAVLLVDGASGRVYQLDPTAKTYTVTVPGVDSSPLPPGVVPPPGVVLPRQEASATLQPASGTRTVAGRPTRKYATTSGLRAEMSGDPTARMPSLRAEGEVWVGEGDQPPPATMAALLPLLLVDEPEAGKRQQKMDRKMERLYDLDMASIRQNQADSMASTMAAMLQPLGEKLAALGKPVLAARFTWSLGPGVPGADFVAEATSIAEATHDEALFTVPTDFRRVGSDPDAASEEVATAPAIPVPATAASFDRLVGVYSLPMGEVAVVRSGERLFAELAGRPREELLPAGADRFRVGNQPATMAFFQNAEGRVTHAIVVMQGTEMRAPRVR